MAVDDHGLEVLKKSGEQVVPGNKSDYFIKTQDNIAIALLIEIRDSLLTSAASIPTVTGSLASPVVITALSGIASADVYNELQFIKSDGGAVVETANPQISPSTKIAAILHLYGTSDTDYLVLSDGNGLLLNGSVQLKSGSNIRLIWNGTTWVEVTRNGI